MTKKRKTKKMLDNMSENTRIVIRYLERLERERQENPEEAAKRDAYMNRFIYSGTDPEGNSGVSGNLYQEEKPKETDLETEFNQKASKAEKLKQFATKKVPNWVKRQVKKIG